MLYTQPRRKPHSLDARARKFAIKAFVSLGFRGRLYIYLSTALIYLLTQLSHRYLRRATHVYL
jgi:hypothetical protein